jgi:hypothetical protein
MIAGRRVASSSAVRRLRSSQHASPPVGLVGHPPAIPPGSRRCSASTPKPTRRSFAQRHRLASRSPQRRRWAPREGEGGRAFSARSESAPEGSPNAPHVGVETGEGSSVDDPPMMLLETSEDDAKVWAEPLSALELDLTAIWSQ